MSFVAISNANQLYVLIMELLSSKDKFRKASKTDSG